jgi:NADH:ubiquinone oxidoreductase subunit E
MSAARWARFVVPILLPLFTSNCGVIECIRLAQQLQTVQEELAQLTKEYPGTSVALGICAASGAQQYRNNGDQSSAAGTVMVCAGTACLFAGFDNCLEVAKHWFELGLRVSAIRARMRELSCDR